MSKSKSKLIVHLHLKHHFETSQSFVSLWGASSKILMPNGMKSETRLINWSLLTTICLVFLAFKLQAHAAARKQTGFLSSFSFTVWSFDCLKALVLVVHINYVNCKIPWWTRGFTTESELFRTRSESKAKDDDLLRSLSLIITIITTTSEVRWWSELKCAGYVC